MSRIVLTDDNTRFHIFTLILKKKNKQSNVLFAELNAPNNVRLKSEIVYQNTADNNGIRTISFAGGYREEEGGALGRRRNRRTVVEVSIA